MIVPNVFLLFEWGFNWVPESCHWLFGFQQLWSRCFDYPNRFAFWDCSFRPPKALILQLFLPATLMFKPSNCGNLTWNVISALFQPSTWRFSAKHFLHFAKEYCFLPWLIDSYLLSSKSPTIVISFYPPTQTYPITIFQWNRSAPPPLWGLVSSIFPCSQPRDRFVFSCWRFC